MSDPALVEAALSARGALVVAGELDAHVIRRARAAGELQRLSRSVYLATPPSAETWRQARIIELAALCRGLTAILGSVVFSRETAAFLHGLSVWRWDQRAHVTAPVRKCARIRKELVRHFGVVEPSDTVTIDGLHCTSLERTVLDCARFMDPRSGLVVVDSALRQVTRPARDARELVDHVAAGVKRRWLDRLAQLGPVPGSRRARAVIEAATPWCESPDESALRWAILAAGLPEPICQYEVRTKQGRYFTDFAWEADDGTVRLHVEVDGAMKYQGTDGSANVVAEKNREDAIRAESGPVLRFSSLQVRDGKQCVERIREALGEAVRRLIEPSRRELTLPLRKSETSSEGRPSELVWESRTGERRARS